jgi:hypothetical protein
MYFKSHDGITEPMKTSSTVQYPGFSLNKGAQLVLADVVQNNGIFQQVAGFKGEIGQIEMSKYFIQDPQYMWNAYASNQSKE